VGRIGEGVTVVDQNFLLITILTKPYGSVNMEVEVETFQKYSSSKQKTKVKVT